MNKTKINKLLVLSIVMTMFMTTGVALAAEAEPPAVDSPYADDADAPPAVDAPPADDADAPPALEGGAAADDADAPPALEGGAAADDDDDNGNNASGSNGSSGSGSNGSVQVDPDDDDDSGTVPNRTVSSGPTTDQLAETGPGLLALLVPSIAGGMVFGRRKKQ